MRRARPRSRVLRAELLSVHAAALFAALSLQTPASPPTLPPAILTLNAAARSEGNRKAEARRLARALLIQTWPAQILKVRVDGAGAHSVAGLVLSGVKFHGRLAERGFIDEVATLVERTLKSSAVEEVDVWVTVPIAVNKGAVVAGDFARPTTRIVFSTTIRRTDATRGARQFIEHSGATYWDPAWRATLNAH